MSVDRDRQLIERLAAAADPVGGDWLDVRRRADAMRLARPWRRRMLLLAAALAIAVAAAIPALGLGDRVVGLFSVGEATTEPIPAAPETAGSSGAVPRLPAYVYGDQLFGVRGGPRALARPLLAPFLGNTGGQALAIPAPDGRSLVYHAGTRVVPSLRVLDLQTGADSVLARNAQSFAWRADGAFAYWQAAAPGYSPKRPFLGHIVVRRSPDERARRWTAVAGEYTALAWARKSLLVAVGHCVLEECPSNLPEGGVYALEGPGRLRPLRLAELTAISPDGRYAVGPEVAGYDAWSPFLRVVRVASGETIVRVKPQDLVDGRVPRRWFGLGIGEGSWVGDRIMAVVHDDQGNGSLVFFRFASDHVTVEHVIRLADTERLGGRGRPYFSAPLFLDRAGHYVAVRTDIPQAGGDVFLPVFLTCNVEERTCSRGPLLPEPRRWLTLVQNPSRPLAPAKRTPPAEEG